MNKVNLIKTLFVAMVVLAASCGKDDEAPSKTGLLTAKTWTNTKMEVSLDGKTYDFTSFIEDCDKDDTQKFNADGTFQYSPGADDCDGDDVAESGTWKLTDGDTKISVTTDGFTEVFTIVTLESTKLVVKSAEEKDDYDGDGDEETGYYILTYTGK